MKFTKEGHMSKPKELQKISRMGQKRRKIIKTIGRYTLAPGWLFKPLFDTQRMFDLKPHT